MPRNLLQLSQFPSFLNGTFKLDVPVYTVWGACEDVQVLEKLRSGEYRIDNLHIIDEAHSHLIDVGGVKLRLLGLGGALVMHKLFDNGEGRTTIAGGQGTMWTTLLQMGELVDTATKAFDPSETRVLVTHASPAREGLLNQLSVNLKIDFSISAGLHFRYGSSYNEFSVNPTLDYYRGKLAASKASFNDVWETVKSEVEPAVADNETQARLLNNAIGIVHKMPSIANGGNPFGGQMPTSGGQVDELAFKNMWNFNLADAAFGWLVLEVEGGRVGTEMRAQGFNFAHRGMKNPQLQADMVKPSAQPNAAFAGTSSTPPIQASEKAPTQITMPTPGPSTQQAPARQPHQQSQSQRPQPPPQTQSQRSAQSTPAPTAQAAAPKPATPANARSPAPPAVNASTKPATPAAAPPSASATPVPNGNKEEADVDETKPNGAAAHSTSDPPKENAPPVQRKPSSGIFISNVNSEAEAKALFSDADNAKMLRMEKLGKYNYVAQFNSPEEMQAVLRGASADLKKPSPGKPNFKPFEDRTGQRRQYDGAGTWGSSRGGSSAQQGSYRTPETTEGESVRGGRGGYRGRGRGNDRARGRGRGGFNKGSGEGGDSTSGPSAAPAPAGSS